MSIVVKVDAEDIIRWEKLESKLKICIEALGEIEDMARFEEVSTADRTVDVIGNCASIALRKVKEWA